MIPAAAPIRQPPGRQPALSDASTEPADPLAALGLGAEWLAPAERAAGIGRPHAPGGSRGSPAAPGPAARQRVRRAAGVLPRYLHVLDPGAGAAAKTLLPPASR
jgi:hypothetical protein